jgi:hypothetical protein
MQRLFDIETGAAGIISEDVIRTVRQAQSAVHSLITVVTSLSWIFIVLQ